MYDQESTDIINYLLKTKVQDKGTNGKFLNQSDFEEILEILLNNLPPPHGVITRFQWSINERKNFLNYLNEINCVVIEDRILPLG